MSSCISHSIKHRDNAKDVFITPPELAKNHIDMTREFAVNFSDEFFVLNLYKAQDSYETIGLFCFFPIGKWFFVEYQYAIPSLSLQETTAKKYFLFKIL